MKMNYIGIACMAVLLLTACDESKYELENLVPDEYHKVLYINNSGMQDLTLYNTGELNTYAFSVYKGGSDPSLTASVEIAIHSQEKVDALYGVNYRVIPSDFYSMDTRRLDFASDERSKAVTLSLSTDLIGAAMEANPEATYVLPLYLTSEKDSVNADKSELFIRIADVLTPTVGFTNTDIQPLSYTYGFDTQSVEIGFGLDTDNNWEVECRFAVDPEYLSSYNGKHGTAYRLLPEGNYSFEEINLLPAGTTTTDLAVSLSGSGLAPGEYMLPVRLDNVSLFNVSANAVYPLVVRVVGLKLDRAGWSIQANTEERTGEGVGNGVATCLLDGQLSTFWHSQWSGGSLPLPHEIVVDMKKETTLTNISLTERQHDSYRDVKGGEFFVSSDNLNWTAVGTFEAQKVLEEQIFSITPTKGRYFKIKITSSYRESNSSLSEVYAYGID